MKFSTSSYFFFLFFVKFYFCVSISVRFCLRLFLEFVVSLKRFKKLIYADKNRLTF